MSILLIKKTLVIESENYYCQLHEEGSDRMGQKMRINHFSRWSEKSALS